MQMRRFASILTVVAGAAALSAAPAGANDGSWPAYGPYGNWAGLYAGGHLGVAFASGEAEATVSGGGLPPISARVEEDDTEVGPGLQVGYNFQEGAAVYGVEGDVTFYDGGNFYSIRGRYGWATPSYLIYGTAGVGFTDSDEDIPGSNDDSPTAFVIGAGAEFDIANYGFQNATAGFEGLYYAFEEQEGDVDLGFARAHYEADASAFVLRGRLNYRFNK